MKVIFNITENKNKATFQQEVVKINTSFNQTQNIVKPKFQIGYYPLPYALDNYYTKNETDLLLENYYLKNETYSKNEVNYFLNSKADSSQLNNYYTKSETFSQAEINNLLNNKQNNLGYTPENSANKSDSYTTSSSNAYASSKALVDGLETKQKKVTVIPITGNTTLSETHNGAVLHVTNSCNITIPTGLDANFQCVIFAKGSIIVTFVNNGVTVYAPSGLLLKTDKMASLICTSANNFNLTGELATS